MASQSMDSSGAWFAPTQRGSRRSARLFAFSHAGGAASAFREWAQPVLPELELWTAQLPGRGTRMSEAPIGNMQRLVSQLEEAITPHLDASFAFVGHSMGAWVAFELARALQAAGKPTPSLLAVSAIRAPHCPLRHKPVHPMSDEALLTELRRIGGTPQSILDDNELLARFLPTIRADHEVIETHFAQPGPIDAPIIALGGSSDEQVTRAELQQWQVHTTGDFHAQWFPGKHFYIYERTAQVVDAIKASFQEAQS